jgi:NAD(P)-dependent dehydrogenase (short-subunit alcohol dehydrogenase family)
VSPGRVHDKIAPVTCGGSGIGRATSILLANEGATDILLDIDAHRAEQVANEIREAGGEAESMRLDVSDETAWVAVMDTILTRT